MGGKIVQLVQGSRKALEFDNFQDWVDRFANYPLVQLIDLDAAMGRGNNRGLVREFARQLPCQVGGGIRSVEAATEILKSGARRVILGSSLISQGAINASFAAQAAGEIGSDKLVFAADCRSGRVAIHGWQEGTGITAVDMMRALEPFCGAFLYTHIDTEGMLQGIPLDVIRELRGATSRQLIAAGGIRSREEIAVLDAMGVDAVVGMAIYTGLISA
jgi:phosphoribosylformimino-5-aminoimidazole carboxamide ribotide isomerase